MKPLIIYQNLDQDVLLKAYKRLIHEKRDVFEADYYTVLGTLRHMNTSIKGYLYDVMMGQNHPILRQVHEGMKLSSFDLQCIAHDLEQIETLIGDSVLLRLDALDIDYPFLQMILEGDLTDDQKAYDELFLLKETISRIEMFVDLIQGYGYGPFAGHQVYRYDDVDAFEPIKDFDALDYASIYGYQGEKRQLDANTKSLIKGLPFNHALLVGASGTGKSSCVKALIKRYASDGLRLIQMDKNQLRQLPEVLAALSESPFKTIVFIDDLSFEVNEDDYKFLKSFIEGSVKSAPKHVAFYLTSNRRHLIKEVRSERENDVHLNDYIEEMTSLSDRFGLTLHFASPDQNLYLEMVEKMLNRVDLAYTKEQMMAAKRFALKQGSMSGRVAEQFVRSVQMAQS